ncbi:hypothetical protein E2C01_095270 [Portunus trituberculatus]|uniref:Uncharacterized protein n=1 Tax=Portunus trituberculatus TaxID=210409 RepID=A0A5B7JSM0_PORTR|nr:hypothetical protein [Portunus trituberculatus]
MFPTQFFRHFTPSTHFSRHISSVTDSTRRSVGLWRRVGAWVADTAQVKLGMPHVHLSRSRYGVRSAAGWGHIPGIFCVFKTEICGYPGVPRMTLADLTRPRSSGGS